MKAISKENGDEYFTNHKTILVGAEPVAVSKKEPKVELGQKYDPYNPRIEYHTAEPLRRDKDLPYSALPGTMARGQQQHERATQLLTLLATGQWSTEKPPERLDDAALLVHVFGVEANKSNLGYMTSVMGLELVAKSHLDFECLFNSCDPTNQRGLCGTGGRLPMASWHPDKQSASLDMLMAIIRDDDSEETAFKRMEYVWNMCDKRRACAPSSVIPMKEMWLLVSWCRLMLPAVSTMAREQALHEIERAMRELLDRRYASPQ